MVGADGGDFTFGDAKFEGSVFAYGDAPNDGGMAGHNLNGTIIAATGW